MITNPNVKKRRLTATCICREEDGSICSVAYLLYKLNVIVDVYSARPMLETFHNLIEVNSNIANGTEMITPVTFDSSLHIMTL